MPLPEATRRDDRANRDRFQDILVAGGILVNVLIVLTRAYFPYVDSTNHLARYVLIARAWAGTAPAGVSFHWIPTGYIGLDVVGAALASVFSARVVLATLASIAVVLPAIGLYALLRVSAPSQRGWAVVGCLLGFNWFVFVGFLSYTIGLGLSFLWLAAWQRSRERPTWTRHVMLTVTAILLYLVHLAAAATILAVLGVALLGDLLNWRAHREDAHAGIQARRTAGLLIVITVGVLGLIYVMKMSAPTVSGPVGGIEFRSAKEKLVHLVAPFYVFSARQAVLLLASFALSLLAFVWMSRPALLRDVWGWSSLALFGAYLILPVAILGGFDVDVRFILPALLLPFASPQRRTPRWGNMALLVPAIGTIAHGVVVAQWTSRIDRDLTTYRQVLRSIPAAGRVLPLIADGERYGRADPYRHFIHWRAIDLNVVTPGLFAAGLGMAHLSHFVIPPRTYYPSEHWGTRDFAPLDWRRLRRDYDYIVLLGNDPRAEREVTRGATLETRRGDDGVYVVQDRP